MTNNDNQYSRELHAAYSLLREALPLARRALVAGGVTIDDQWQFWYQYIKLEKFVDLDEDSQGLGMGIDRALEDIEKSWPDSEPKS